MRMEKLFLMNISFSAAVNSLSYGYCTSYFIQELSKLGHRINLFPIGQPEQINEYIVPALNNAMSANYTEPVIRLFHQNLLHQRIGKGKHFGFPIFELDTFDQQEKNSINSCDELIVPSQWAKEVCINNGINIPIHVVPLGVDRDIFYDNELPLTDEICYFNIGKIEKRKGHDILPAAFNDAFSDPKYNVRLFLACNGHPAHYSEQEVEAFKKSFTETKLSNKIHFLPRFSSQKEVSDLIRKCHCGIFASRAEGWNLPLLETLSCGRYAVATYCTAHTEFLNDYNSFHVAAQNKVPAIDGKWFNGKGNWHDIDYDHLVSTLRDSYHIIKERNCANLEGIKTGDKYTWKNASNKLLEVLNV